METRRPRGPGVQHPTLLLASSLAFLQGQVMRGPLQACLPAWSSPQMQTASHGPAGSQLTGLEVLARQASTGAAGGQVHPSPPSLKVILVTGTATFHVCPSEGGPYGPKGETPLN